MPYSITRYHDISCGHRVHGHESKCAMLHGHNYRVFFTVEPTTMELDFQTSQRIDGAEIVVKPDHRLDDLGRVIDFSVVKVLLCGWLESHWDHRFLCWDKDPVMRRLAELSGPNWGLGLGLVFVPFNPTAENMAAHLVNVVGPQLLTNHAVRLVRCVVEETRKCSATYEVTR